jgi:hypothetical protein
MWSIIGETLIYIESSHQLSAQSDEKFKRNFTIKIKIRGIFSNIDIDIDVLDPLLKLITALSIRTTYMYCTTYSSSPATVHDHVTLQHDACSCGQLTNGLNWNITEPMLMKTWQV